MKKRIVLAVLVVVALCTGVLVTQAAPTGYPWYNSSQDARQVFNAKESTVFDFFTAKLIQMKDHPDAAVQNVADGIVQEFLEKFELIEPGADPATEPVFAEERQEVKRILFLVSPPADGGNADTVWEALKSTLVVISPPTP